MTNKSSYFDLYFTGNNDNEAEEISNFFTNNHSNKIKSGNYLQKNIMLDFPKNSEFIVYENKSFNDLENLENKKHLFFELKMQKSLYDTVGVSCKNKKCYKLDIVFIENKNVMLFELKSGINFDTKKSKGEIDTLMDTKKVFENYGYNVSKIGIISYQANSSKEIIIKTNLRDVELFTFNDFLKIIGINDCDKMKERINNNKIIKSKKRINECKKKITELLKNDLQTFFGDEEYNKFLDYMEEKYK